MSGRALVSRNGTILLPYPEKIRRLLRARFGVYDEVYHTHHEKTGFDVPYADTTAFITHKMSSAYIQQLVPDYQIEYVPTIRPVYLSGSFSFRDDFSVTPIQADMAKAIFDDPNHFEWFINLQTGEGKTVLSVYIAAEFGEKMYITVHRKTIIDQWVEEIVSKTHIPSERICVIDSSYLLQAIMDDTFAYEDKDVFLSTPGILTSYGKRNGFDTLGTIGQRLGIGTFIFDEAHRETKNLVLINACMNTHRALYLSADYAKAAERDDQLYKKIFYGVPILAPPAEVAEDLRHTTAIVLKYRSDVSRLRQDLCFGQYGFNSQEFEKLQLEVGMCQKAVFQMIDQIRSVGTTFRILLLFSLIDSVDKMTIALKERYGDDFVIGKAHSKVSAEEKEFTRNYANLIVSTYSSYGTGTNIKEPPIKYVISTNICDKISDNQAAGRGRRLPDGSDNCYILLADQSFAYVRKRTESRLDYLKSTKIKEIHQIYVSS